MRIRALAACTALLLCLDASAVRTRADRDDAEYLELASRYPAALAMAPAAGEGVLIAPRFVLTAASVARRLAAMRPLPLLLAGGRRHAIRSIALHPQWRGAAEHDIALIFLADAVDGVTPAPVYRKGDEEGKTVAIVGHGASGRIGAHAPTTHDGRARAAINTVDRAAPLTLELTLKGPEEASDLQGAAAADEQGAPAFIEGGDAIYVAGIGHGARDGNADGIAGDVGDRETYARVSALAEWIDQAMFRAATAEAAEATRRR
jgi:trypsin